jgi:hypothetical protein
MSLSPDQCDIGKDGEVTVTKNGADEYMITFWFKKEQIHVNVPIKDVPKWEKHLERWCKEKLEEHRESIKNIRPC